MGAAAACQDILPQVLDAVEGGAGGGEEHLAVGVAEKQAGGALGDLDGVDVPGGNPLLQIPVLRRLHESPDDCAWGGAGLIAQVGQHGISAGQLVGPLPVLFPCQGPVFVVNLRSSPAHPGNGVKGLSDETHVSFSRDTRLVADAWQSSPLITGSIWLPTPGRLCRSAEASHILGVERLQDFAHMVSIAESSGKASGPLASIADAHGHLNTLHQVHRQIDRALASQVLVREPGQRLLAIST